MKKLKAASLFALIMLVVLPCMLWSFKKQGQEVSPALKDSDFYQIYAQIFKPSCSVAGCHDGSFEPNFSTLQSSYFTLVWHPIIKNNREKEYEYRVVPGDTMASVLYRRVTDCCFVDQNDRMPFYDKKGLSEEQIMLIAKWITDGAPDVFGTSPSKACRFPIFGKLEILEVSKTGEQTIVNTTQRNDQYEPVGLKVTKDMEKLLFRIPLTLQKDLCAPIDSMIFQLQFFNDPLRASENLLFKKTMVMDGNHQLELELLRKDLQPNKALYFQIEAKAGKRVLSYKEMFRSQVANHSWCIILE